MDDYVSFHMLIFVQIIYYCMVCMVYPIIYLLQIGGQDSGLSMEGHSQMQMTCRATRNTGIQVHIREDTKCSPHYLCCKMQPSCVVPWEPVGHTCTPEVLHRNVVHTLYF